MSNTSTKTTIVKQTTKSISSQKQVTLQSKHYGKQQQQVDENQKLNENTSMRGEEKILQSNVKDTFNHNMPEDSANNGNKNAYNKKKMKSKRHKKGDLGENISMKSSFSKFSSLEKRNTIHVGSSDANKAQEKFSNAQTDKEANCCLCSKPVYKMEEIKAETNIYHKNCFRCRECNISLNLQNYRSHEGFLYCMVHFKLLFMPKVVPDSKPEQSKKPELIIRENQPDQLPPDVIRASDKSNLGLEELQQLNVRSKFQVFENSQQVVDQREKLLDTAVPVKRSASILSKITKLKNLGITINLKNDNDYDQNENIDQSNSDQDDDDDVILERSKNHTERERPIGLGCNMNDIKSKFEKEHLMSKNERREERKQEIQNIRSRLFMGKQARIKEMYQQAVAESENAISSADKKPIIEINTDAQSIKERFERGEVFRATQNNNIEDDNENVENSTVNGQEIKNKSIDLRNDVDVFESAISKKSRRMFMELDANIVAENQQSKHQQSSSKIISNNSQKTIPEQKNSKDQSQDLELSIVKCDEKPEDVKIATSEISEKFKFFESYRPTESKRKVFRITPPREGVVKMPTPPPDSNTSTLENNNDNNFLEVSPTTRCMLKKFREFEEKNKSICNDNNEPKPLKCFTPPPDDGRRYYRQFNNSDSDSQEEYDDDEVDTDDDDYKKDDYINYENDALLYKSMIADDEALKEAQAVARAKVLRAKFEHWASNEKKCEDNHNSVNIYSPQVSDSTTIESTKIICEHFENMKNKQTQAPKSLGHQVNRFK